MRENLRELRDFFSQNPNLELLEVLYIDCDIFAMLLEEVERQTSVPESLLPPDPKIEKVCLLGCVKKAPKESTLVYDQNPYFCLGPIPKPKPKLADTFGRYRNPYRNHISKGESRYR